uniref:NADH dehydrogenase n=1 Tax=Pseudodiaptomus poplesia TaxID=213370 RepID=A0A0U2TLF1_9MAXI|nr:NADH dehydrogenase [Pseudodiaptomus poplesia]
MSGKYDEVDPRVQWAMNVLDDEGQTYESQTERLLPGIMVGITPAFGNMLYNFTNKIPIHTNWMKAAITFPLGFGLYAAARNWKDGIRAENQAVMKRYIMTHPELFPEPKRVKYIDFIEPWRPVRY